MNIKILNENVCKNNNVKLSKETKEKIIGYFGWESRYIPTVRTFQKTKQNK